MSTSRHTDALVLLSELRIRKVNLPLGSLNRWVRECDAASRSDGSFGDEQVLKVLDAILRCTNVDQAEEESNLPAVVKQAEWMYRPTSGLNLWAQIQAGDLPKPEHKLKLAARFKLCENLGQTQAA